MSYKYDVFISYPHGQWSAWLKEKFVPLFDHWLWQELGRRPQIFVDYDEIPQGSTWPVELGNKLARSKMLLPMCARPYLASDWCKRELAMMMAREREVGYRTHAQPRGLIVPIIIHDGDDFRDILRPIQCFDIHSLTSLHLCPNSLTAERLENEIKQIAVRVAETIGIAPTFHPDWPQLFCDEFLKLFESRARPTSQPVLPTLAE